MPALPLDEAGKYVAGAYVVFIALILIYVAIISAKIARIARQIDELAEGDGEGASCWPSASLTRRRRWQCASASGSRLAVPPRRSPSSPPSPPSARPWRSPPATAPSCTC